jgi:hypothetical protein
MKVVLRQSSYPLLRHRLWFHIISLRLILLPVLQYCIQVSYLLPALTRITAAALHLLPLLAGGCARLLLVLLAAC